MLRSVFAKTLHDARRSFPAWCLGIVATVAMIGAIYPSIKGTSEIADLIKNYPDALKSLFGISGATNFGTGTGYLQTELFSFMLPILLLVAAIGAGARSIAGEEEAGTLELVLSHPVSRLGVLGQKAAAHALMIVGMGCVAWVSLVVCNAAFSMKVGLGALAAACLCTTLIALHIGTITFAIGAVTGRRVIALGAGSAVAVLSFLWNGLAPLVSALDRLRWMSPWYHALGNDPLSNGVDWARFTLLVAVTAVFGTVAVVGFARRDLGR